MYLLVSVFNLIIITVARITDDLFHYCKCSEEERLCYVCNPRSLNEGMETSWQTNWDLARETNPLRVQLYEPMDIGMQYFASGCHTPQHWYKRQQVHRINSCFR